MLSFEFLLCLSAILKLDFLKSPVKSGSARPPRGIRSAGGKGSARSSFRRKKKVTFEKINKRRSVTAFGYSFRFVEYIAVKKECKL